MYARRHLRLALVPIPCLLAGLWSACGTEEAAGGPTPCSLDAACGPGEVCDVVAQICVSLPPGPDVAGDGSPADVPAAHDLTPDLEVAGPDQAPDGPLPDPCEAGGALGCPCAKGSECDSGFCVDTDGGKVCSATCTSTGECAGDLVCLPTGASDAAIPAYLCLAPDAKLCQPCAADADCVSADGGLGVSRCLGYGDEGRFCGQFCGEDGLCPDGYTCDAVESVDGVTSAQCVRDDAICTCRGLSRLLTLGTICAVTNGVGSCAGERVCGPTGLTECDGAQAAEEVCDGADNDCDKEVDEDSCDDGLPCTIDTCDPEAALCAHEPDDGACDDGVPCTVDTCDEDAATCVSIPDDGACDDDDPCTTDGCDAANGCQAAPADGAECDDDDPCTSADVCTAGTCGGSPFEPCCIEDAQCDDVNPCTLDVCDLGDHACTNESSPLDGEPCDADDDGCTQGDACSAGSCLAGAAAACAEPEDPCTVVSCVSTGPSTYSCNSQGAPEGGACDDQNPCTVDDTCDAAGQCVPGTVNDACCLADSECDDQNPCTLDACDVETHTCQHDGAPLDGTTCSDGDGCTVSDACQAGQCQPGDPGTCGASPDPCQVYGCVSAGDDAYTCELEPALAGTPCSDQNPCTEPDACDGTGACVSGAVQAGCCTESAECDNGNPCTVDTCDDATHLCNHVTLPDDTTCNSDGDGCTVGDACFSGVCAPGSPVECGVGNVCKLEICKSTSATSYICETTLAGGEVPCDDGQACTVGDSCDGAGQCQGDVKDCSAEAGPCRVGLCEEDVGGCTFTNLDDGASCNADENGCTVGDSCTSGFCLPGDAVDCSNYDAVCLTGICQNEGPDDYACGTVADSAGTLCDDGDFCTIDDGCDGAGACTGGGARDCQAEVGDQCNSGSCDEAAQACVKFKVGEGTACDDDQACTLSSSCQNGTCIGAENICVDERLDVAGSGTSSPSIASLGYGRYVVQWAGGNTENHLRLSDAHGSRENEEISVGSAGTKWRAGISVQPSGAFTVMHRSGPTYWKASNAVGGGCHSWWYYHHGVHASTYLVDGTLSVSDQLVNQDSWARRSLTTSQNMPNGLDFMGKPLRFTDGSYGFITTFRPTFTWYICDEGGSPPLKEIRFTPATSDLASDTGVTLVPAAQVYDAKAVDAAPMPDGTDRFLVAWVGPLGKEVYVQSFLKDGSPDELAAWTVVYGEPGIVSAVRVRPFEDGVALVLWQVDGKDGDGEGIYGQRLYPDGTLLGASFIVNGATAGDQRLGDMGIFADGSWVVVYDDSQGDTVGWGVKARRFSAVDSPEPEILVNTNQDGNQYAPSVGILSSEDWLVAFIDSEERVWTRRFYKDGTPSAGVPERRANLTTAGAQTAPVAARSDEDTVLLVYGTPVPGKEDGEIVARPFSSDGLEPEDEVIVNTTTNSVQSNPAVTGGPDRFVVAWNSQGEDGSLDGIFARLMDGSGAPLANPFGVNTTTNSYQRFPDVDMRPDGQFAVVWNTHSSAPGSVSDVAMRIFDKDAGELAGELIVNDTSPGAQDRPSVAGVPDKQEWLVVWQSDGQDGDGFGIYLRKISSAGASLSDEVQVNAFTVDEQKNPRVAMSDDGASAAVCWETYGQDDPATPSWGVACTILEVETLAIIVPEFLLNTYTDGDQRAPAPEWLPSGELMVAWETAFVDGDERAVQYRRISVTLGPVGTRVVANRTWEGDQYAPFVVPLADSGFWVGWETGNQDGDGAGVTYRVLPPQ